MSLRDKAREVKAAGEAERGNFTPHGVPKRVFDWWLQTSGGKKARRLRAGTMKENFCHFWRVVLIWAPLLWVGEAVDKYWSLFCGLFGLLSAVVLVILLVNDPLAVLGGIGFILGMLALGVGLIAGVSAGLTPEQRRDYDLISNKKLLVITFIIGLPTAVLAYLVTRAMRFYADHLIQYSKQIFLGALGTALVAGVVLGGTLGGWLDTLWVVLTSLGIVAGMVILFAVLWTVGTYVEGKRALSREKQRQAAAVYIAETGDLPPVKPSRTSRFFSGLGDFLVLLVQVVRVKKWKICPIVEIDK